MDTRDKVQAAFWCIVSLAYVSALITTACSARGREAIRHLLGLPPERSREERMALEMQRAKDAVDDTVNVAIDDMYQARFRRVPSWRRW